MKKEFVQPDISINTFAAEDVVTASGTSEGYAPDTGGSHDFGERT